MQTFNTEVLSFILQKPDWCNHKEVACERTERSHSRGKCIISSPHGRLVQICLLYTYKTHIHKAMVRWYFILQDWHKKKKKWPFSCYFDWVTDLHVFIFQLGYICVDEWVVYIDSTFFLWMWDAIICFHFPPYSDVLS